MLLLHSGYSSHFDWNGSGRWSIGLGWPRPTCPSAQWFCTHNMPASLLGPKQEQAKSICAPPPAFLKEAVCFNFQVGRPESITARVGFLTWLIIGLFKGYYSSGLLVRLIPTYSRPSKVELLTLLPLILWSDLSVRYISCGSWPLGYMKSD